MKKEVYRTVFKKEILCEFVEPAKESSRVIILCSGMPGYPAKRELLERLSKRGYWVFLPRYRGTWESKGSFLKYSPEKDIKDVVDSVHHEITELWNKKKFRIENPKIFVLGWSFGGPAVILNSSDKRVKKVLAISPVIDWRIDSKIEPMDKELEYMKTGFHGSYRCRDSDWKRLAEGKMYNPIDEIDRVDAKKIWIMQALDDESVNPGPSKVFARKTGCKITLFKKGGHSISYKVLKKRRFLRKIDRWFD